jgi:hypothetical protein
VGTLDGVAGLNRRSLRLKLSSDADCHGVGMPDLGYRPPMFSGVRRGRRRYLSFFSRTCCLEDADDACGIVRDVGIICP